MIGPTHGETLHVMSFNLRFASDRTPNSWPQRRPAMAELLRDEQPTVIGTQEGLYGQLQDIEADLPKCYDWIGTGRAGGSRDEFMAIFYDTRRLAPVEFDHFWLSDTPQVIGSKSWGSGSIRMVTQVHFTDQTTGAELIVLNTHFDNYSENARIHGAELLRDRINAISPRLPVILTGDFNAPAQTSTPYTILVDHAGLTDTWIAATTRRTPQYATWHGYHPPTPDGPRIDWILTKGINTRSTGINTFAHNGQLPSDHFPIQALITID